MLSTAAFHRRTTLFTDATNRGVYHLCNSWDSLVCNAVQCLCNTNAITAMSNAMRVLLHFDMQWWRNACNYKCNGDAMRAIVSAMVMQLVQLFENCMQSSCNCCAMPSNSCVLAVKNVCNIIAMLLRNRNLCADNVHTRINNNCHLRRHKS